MHYENCCRKYFHVFCSILKMLFSYKFFIRQFNPRQQTLAIKSHNHQNTTTTPPQQQQKSKSHRNQNHIEREIGGAKIGGSKARLRGGEIERRGAIGPVRSERSMRSARCDQRNRSCDRRGAIWCMRSSDWSSRFADNCRTGLELEVRRQSSDWTRA